MTDVRLVEEVNDAIRDNPLAAALVGAGVFWMLFGSKVPALVSALPHAADAAAQAGKNIINSTNATVAGVSSRVGATLDTTRDAVNRVIPDGGETMSHAWNDSVDTTNRFATTSQKQLAEAMERQPLVLGALGVAIGVGMAMAFPTTRLENRLVGEQGAAARETISKLAGEAKDFAAERGRQVLDDVKDEAEIRGLTSGDARDAFDTVVSKVKNVAGASQDSATSPTRRYP